VTHPGQSINIPARAYTVKPGESFETVAKKLNVGLSALEGLNPQISNPDFIVPNELLKVPASNLQDPFVYTVKAKDTLFSIARILQIAFSELEDANPQKNHVSVGQIVKGANLPTK
jgi:LysM repeat protein